RDSHTQLCSHVLDVGGDNVPVLLRRIVSFLVRPVFGGAGEEGGQQAACPSMGEVVVVGGGEHDLVGAEIEEFGDAEIGFRVGLEMPEQVGAEDHVPGGGGEL